MGNSLSDFYISSSPSNDNRYKTLLIASLPPSIVFITGPSYPKEKILVNTAKKIFKITPTL